jgi:hypothetical protein
LLGRENPTRAIRHLYHHREIFPVPICINIDIDEFEKTVQQENVASKTTCFFSPNCAYYSDISHIIDENICVSK